MFSHTVTRTYNDGLANIGGLETITADTQIAFDGSVAGGATNYEIDVALTQANLKAVMLHCDRALTIKTNNSGSPQETISLVAGQALIWSLAHDGGSACPFAGDVTKFYATLAAGAAATLKLRALSDQTPA